MATDLYSKLYDLDLLRRSWHLARADSQTDFVLDPYRFSDFALHLDGHLEGIALDLSRDCYHPKRQQVLDVPKSSLSVRPGSILDIEDKIVLYAIACIIAPSLDKKLPEGVYSFRYIEGKRKKLFRDHEILKFPFLKRKTILSHLSFVEPWYESWPKFDADSKYAYEHEGYNYLVISDIASYFENIDITILCATLTRHFPKQQRIINFLRYLFEYWTWPTVHGGSAPQGLPQGHAVSSFLSNIYLLPLDEAMREFGRSHDIRYFRYIDDIRVFAKEHDVAISALFLMNQKLRELRLNIQGSKTRIIDDTAIKDEFYDDRMDKLNSIIEATQKKNELTTAERRAFIRELKEVLHAIKKRKQLLQGKDLRLFKRLITGFSLLQSSEMADDVLIQMEINPDAGLVKKAARYAGYYCSNRSMVPKIMAELLHTHSTLFPYQEAFIYYTLRFVRNIPGDALREARRCIDRKKEPWFVKQQAALLLSQKCLTQSELRSYRSLFGKEKDPEVKRTIAQILAQLPKDELQEIASNMLYTTNPTMQRVGRFFSGLLKDEQKGLEELESVFREFSEAQFIDRIYEIEILSKADSLLVRTKVLRSLIANRRHINRPLLTQRTNRIVSRLEVELA